MRRIVRGAVLAIGACTAVAGCGSKVAVPTQQELYSDSLTAAVLTQQDVPRGFLPAQAQPVFRGVVPRDPACRRLLALADGYGLRDVPKAATAFYQMAPGTTLSQQIWHVGGVNAATFVREAKVAAASCPTMHATVSGTDLVLNRDPLATDGLPPGSYAVRYRQAATADRLISYEMVFARTGDELVLLAAPGVANRRAPVTILAAARKATAKLSRATAASLVSSTTTTAPTGRPAPVGPVPPRPSVGRAVPMKPAATPKPVRTQRPVVKPTRRAAVKPTRRASAKPTRRAVVKPSRRASAQPTRRAVVKPTRRPAVKPTRRVTVKPTRQIVVEPSRRATARPTATR
ncbi:hypothetical protein GCM10027589_44740 [Actinocorallia lasiicapitis]